MLLQEKCMEFCCSDCGSVQ